MKIVSINGQALEHVIDTFKDDFDIVLQAVKSYGCSLIDAS